MRLPPVSNRTVMIAAGAVALMVVATIVLKKTPPPTPPEPIPFLLSNADPAAPSAKPTGPKDAATTVLELFNPSDTALTHQINETNVSQQIEQLMATSFVLTNCNLISSDDYRRTYQASIIYAQKNKIAPDKKTAATKVHRITKSAGASYALIYKRTKCDDAKLPAIAQQLKTWVSAYLLNDPRTAGLKPD